MKKYTFTFIVLFFSILTYSQNQNKRWYFSTNTTGFDFNLSTNALSITNEHGALPYEGIGVANDYTTGDLLFYTDGIKVYDKQHLQMTNGSGLLGGVSATQTGLICPVPNQSGKYFIISNSGNAYNGAFTNGKVRYSIVDMNLVGNGSNNSKNGEVAAKNIYITSNSCEAVELFANHNNTAFWLVVPSNNSDSIKFFKADSSGISFSHFVNTGSSMKSTVAARYSFVNRKISFGSINDTDPVLIYDVNIETGQLSNKQIVPGTPFYTSTHSQSDYAGVIDLEWSEDGSKLYISTLRGGNTSGGKLYQYDLNSQNTLINLIFDVSSSSNSLSGRGMKRGPDGKIYYLYTPANSIVNLIGVINLPNNAGSNCNFNANEVSISVDLATTSKFCEFLPELNPICSNPPSVNLSFLTNCSAPNACDGEISVQSSGGIMPYQYELNGAEFGSTSLFGDLCNGLYTITISDSLSCSASLTVEVNTDSISNPCANSNLSVSISAVNPTTSCNGTASANVYGGTAPYLYSWSNLYYTQSIGNLCTGTYSVNVTDANGCMAFATKVIVGNSTQPLHVFLQQNNSTGVAQCNGRAKVSASGGVPPYSFLFSQGTTGNLATHLCAGMYSVTATDAVGSQASYSFIISHPYNTQYDSSTVRPDSTVIAMLTHSALEDCDFSYSSIDSVNINSFYFNSGYDSVIVKWIVFSAGTSYTTNITYAIGSNGVYTLQLNMYCPSRSSENSMIAIGQIYVDKTTLIQKNVQRSNVISPNPFRSNFTVSEAYIGGTITIYNTSGKTVCKASVQSITVTNLSEYPAGLYLIQLEKNGTITRSKVIKE